MKKTQKTLLALAILIPICLAIPATAAKKQESDQEPTVLATASNIGYFTDEIAGQELKVETLVPAGACPGHYDTSPEDIQTVTEADMILWNGFEPWLEDLVESSGNSDVIVKKAPRGAWGPPPKGELYTKKIANFLIQTFPQHEEKFESRKNELLSEINSTTENLKKRARNREVDNVKVICNDKQKPFVEWLGFNVVESYPSPEQLSTSDVSNIMAMAENEDVAMIISNNASGTQFGEKVSTETGVEHVVLGNFPGWIEKADTYVGMIETNADRLFFGLESYRNREGTVSDLEKEIDDIELQRNATIAVAAVLALIVVFQFFIIRRK